MSFDVQAAIAQAAAQGPDMTTAKSGGGGGYTPPEAGVCLATLVGYIEIGKHRQEFNDKGKKVVKEPEQVQLIFELAGGKNQPRVNEETGEKIPHRITITETLSLNEKANFFKLFRKLNHDGAARHCSQLLGKHWLVTVFHVTKGEGDNKRTYANLKNEDGYSFRPPVRVVGDELSGDAQQVPIAAPERISELRLFLWDFPSKEMWDSLYIDGEYPARKDEKTGKEISPARSKNVIQDKIRSAINFRDSQMAEILNDGDLATSELDAPAPVESTASAGAGDDPLAGL